MVCKVFQTPLQLALRYQTFFLASERISESGPQWRRISFSLSATSVALAEMSGTETSVEALAMLVEMGCSSAAGVAMTVLKVEAKGRSCDTASFDQKAKAEMQRTMNFIMMMVCCCKR